MRLKSLRRIIFTFWDPLRLATYFNRNPETSVSGEYDYYIFLVVTRLMDGQCVEDVAEFLFLMETERFGLPATPQARERALKTVRELQREIALMPQQAFVSAL